MVAIDAYSKWPEAFPLKSASSSATIVKLRALFASHGIFDSVVSVNNNSPFASTEMKDFVAANGVEQIMLSPYHPASNELAERAVQTCKAAIKKIKGTSLETKLQCFFTKLLYNPTRHYRVPPCQLLMGRQYSSWHQ